MFDWSGVCDELRCRPVGWLEARRVWLVAEQRRLHLEELAVTRVLDEHGRIDDTTAAVDGVDVRDVRATVATARALDALPRVAAAAAEGRLSVGQLQAVTRVADAGSDSEWAERAPTCAPSELQRAARAQQPPSAVESRRRWESRSLRYWWEERTGMLEGRFALPDLVGAAFESVIHQITETQRPEQGTPWAPWDQRAADALIALVHRAGGDPNTAAAGVAPKVVVHVPASGPAEVTHGVFLSTEQLEQMHANAVIEAVLVDEHGTVLATRRAASAVTDRLRRQIVARDGRCRWPGCETRHGLEVHHMVPVSWGGPTLVANLVTVCAPHHRRLVPHGPHTLTGNPALPGGIRLERARRPGDPAHPHAPSGTRHGPAP